MRRTDIERRIKNALKDARAKIEASPLASFWIGYFLGVLSLYFSSLVLPLVVVALLALVGLWFFAEEDGTNP